MMWRVSGVRPRAVLVAILAVLLPLAGCGSSGGQGARPASAGGQDCASSVTAPGPRLRPPSPIQVVGLPAAPYAVAADAGWAFASLPGQPGPGQISVLAMRGSAARLVRTVGVPGQPLGVTLAGGNRFLVAANAEGGPEIFSTSALETGRGAAMIAQLPSRGSGGDEVALSGNGRYAFVTEENTADVAVYDLGGLLTGGASPGHGAQAREIGSVRVPPSPSGIAMSPGGSRIYVVSQYVTASSVYGELSAISVARAEQDPVRALIGSISAGCDPVRLALSGNGRIAWVTNRQGNTVSAFRLNPAGGPAIGGFAGSVRVGSSPVGVTLAGSGALVLVTDSARFTAPDTDQTVAVVSAARALDHRPALVGYLPAGAFPRQFGQAAGGPLLFTDYDSSDVRVVSNSDLRWLSTLRVASGG
jgi:DNA-binding beta-propeller fold protein YncE